MFAHLRKIPCPDSGKYTRASEVTITVISQTWTKKLNTLKHDEPSVGRDRMQKRHRLYNTQLAVLVWRASTKTAFSYN